MRYPFLFVLLFITTARAQITHYALKLTPDLDHQLLHGQETITFWHDQWEDSVSETGRPTDFQPDLHRLRSDLADETVNVHLRRSGKHVLHFAYTAAPHRGITWFSGSGWIRYSFLL